MRTFGKGASLAVNNDPGNGTGINLVFGGGDSLDMNTWHHIAATYDGTLGKVYIDGLLVASNRFSIKLLNSSVPLTIGQKNPPGGPLVTSFLGLIDEVLLLHEPARAARQDFVGDAWFQPDGSRREHPLWINE